MGGGESEAGPPSPWAGGPAYKYPAEEPGKGMFKWQWLPVSHHCTENLAPSRMLWSVSVTGIYQGPPRPGGLGLLQLPSVAAWA